MPALSALILLVATAGLAAVAFALFFIHATSCGRDDADAAFIAALHTYYLDLEVLEQRPTEPLLDVSVAPPAPILDEQGA